MSNNLTKVNYKLFMFIMKYIPCVLGIIQIICLTLNYFGVNAFMLTCLGGASYIFIGVLYMFSYVFRFCHLYRIPLYYITVITIIASLDSFIGIPFDTLTLYRIYTLITGISIITYIIYVYKNRNKPKIDYLKQLCDNYC